MLVAIKSWEHYRRSLWLVISGSPTGGVGGFSHKPMNHLNAIVDGWIPLLWAINLKPVVHRKPQSYRKVVHGKKKSAVPFQHITRPFVQTLETSPTVTFMPISGLGRLSKNGGLLSFAGSIQSPWSRYITPTDSLRGQEAAWNTELNILNPGSSSSCGPAQNELDSFQGAPSHVGLLSL